MKKVGLALSSGGARGYSNIGVVKALIENKIPINCIAGTSMGAVVASYYAINKEISGLEKVICAIKKRDMIGFIDLNDPRKSIVKGEKVKAFLTKLFGEATFSDIKIPLSIGATSLQTGESVVFTSGRIVDAIMASGAFPGVFPTVPYKGHDLVDGGLAEAIPVKMVREMGAEVIIAVDLFCIRPNMARRFSFMVDVLERTIELLQSKLSDYNLSEYGKNIIILRPDTGSRLQTFSLYKGKAKILEGYIETKKHMDEIKKLVK